MNGRAFDNAAMVEKAHDVRADLGAPMVILCVLDGAGRMHLVTSYDGERRELAVAMVGAISATCREAGMARAGGTPEHAHKGKDRGDA